MINNDYLLFWFEFFELPRAFVQLLPIDKRLKYQCYFMLEFMEMKGGEDERSDLDFRIGFMKIEG
jgi:hypothetical protein